MTWTLCAFLVLAAVPTLQAPIVQDRFPLEQCEGEGGIKAAVGGKPAIFAFDATWPLSYIVGGTGKVEEIAVGGKTRVTVPLVSIKKEDLPEDAAGVLGADALRKMTLAFDPLAETVEFVGGPKFGQAAAERYFGKLPSWDGLAKVVRLPLQRAQDGTPLLTARIVGRETQLAPRLSPLGSILDKTVPRPKEVAGKDDWDYLSGVGLAGLGTSWTAYNAQDDYSEGGHGMLALDVFASRRVLVDLGDDAMYVERLSDDGRASLFLTRMLGLPLIVRGKALMLGLPPGEESMNGAEEIPENVEIVSVANVSGADWIADLRADAPEATARLVGRLAKLSKGYEVVALDGEGNEDRFTVPSREDPKRSMPAAWLRAVERARVASPSR